MTKGATMSSSKRNGRWGARAYDPQTHAYIWLGTFDRKKDADAKERETRQQLALGTYQPPKPVRFSEFADKWIETLTVRPSTLADYKNTCRHLKDRFGKRHLSAITTEDVESFVADYAETHAPTSTRKAVTRLRQIYGRAIAWRYVTIDPTRGISNLPKNRTQRKIQVLTPAQVADFLAASPDYWRPLFLTAVSTGLRRGELFGLTWDCLLWTQRKIVVRHQLTGGKLGAPKSESALRQIDVGPGLLKALTEHRKHCPQSDFGLMFPAPSGIPVHTSDFNRDVFKPTAATALLPDLVLHDLRHTYASALIHQGQSVKYVQTVMGHASAQTTLDVYGHLLDGGGQDAARSLERWLEKVPRRNRDATGKGGKRSGMRTKALNSPNR
jgi:integrase